MDKKLGENAEGKESFHRAYENKAPKKNILKNIFWIFLEYCSRVFPSLGSNHSLTRTYITQMNDKLQLEDLSESYLEVWKHYTMSMARGGLILKIERF